MTAPPLRLLTPDDLPTATVDGHYTAARFLPADRYPCLCVVEHRPAVVRTQRHHVWPLGWGGPRDGLVVPLCGTAHDNVHILLDAYRRAGGVPGWDVRRQFGLYLRDVAAAGWAAYLDGQNTAGELP